MALFGSKKSKEFWGLIAAAGVCYGLSTIFKSEDLQNVLIVVAAVLFIIAIYRLKRSY
jgi:Na+/citrate or Na+/malate symporter